MSERRTIIVGDVHACHDELVALMAQLELADEDLVVSVGDLVDRGPDPAGVLTWFRDRPNSVVLAGNHERKHVRQVFSYAQEITRLQLGAAYEGWVAWMATLPYFLELPEAIVVHAAAVPGVPIAAQRPEILCGSTAGEDELATLVEGDWTAHWHGPKPVIFGHRVVEQPLVRAGLVYGLDTGACHGGALTALSLPDFQLHAVPARDDHWKHVKRVWQARVLAAKPWNDLAWPELDEQLARFAGASEPATRDYVAALRCWREELAVRIDDTHAALLAELARLERDTPEAALRGVLAAHPLSGFLFQVRRGRLDREAFRAQVRSPRKLATLDEGLGRPVMLAPALAISSPASPRSQ